MIALALPIVLMLQQSAPTMSTCLKDGEPVTGEMRWVETRDPAPAKQPERRLPLPNAKPSELRSPFLVLPKLSCFDTAKGRAFGRWIQLGLSRDDMKTLVPGAPLTVKAQFVIPTSAYHIGDVVAFDAVIVPQSPP